MAENMETIGNSSEPENRKEWEERMEARYERLLGVCDEEDRKSLDFFWHNIYQAAWEDTLAPEPNIDDKKDKYWMQFREDGLAKYEKKYGIENPVYGIDREEK